MDDTAELTFAVEQTIAAERLEGWAPTAEHRAALHGLTAGELTFGEYLAPFRNRFPPVTPHRPWLRRRKPYLIPGTTVLRNNFGVDAAAQLRELEFVATAGRIAQWHVQLVRSPFTMMDIDFRRTHQHVFADVYTWAGEYRVTELRRGAVVFGARSAIASSMADIEAAARRLGQRRAQLEARPDAAELAYHLARMYATYNQVHPFREGNGRTGTLVLHTVVATCGHRLDLSVLDRAEWYAASADSMPFRRDGVASARPFLPLFLRALR